MPSHDDETEFDEPAPLYEIALSRPMGRPRKFKDPQDMSDAALAYFKWAKQASLQEDKVFSTGKRMVIDHPHALTLEGFQLHAGIGVQTWYDYKAKDEFSEICGLIENSMFEHSYTLAAAGLLNHAIVARKLGLADKQEVTTSPAKTLLDAVHEADENT